MGNLKLQNIIGLTIINTIICTIVFAVYSYLKLYNEYGYELVIGRWYSYVRDYCILCLIMSLVYSILFFSFRLYEKPKKQGLWLLKIFITIFILWTVGLLLVATNTFYWGINRYSELGEWWLYVLGEYLEICFFGFFLIFGIWIAPTIITSYFFSKKTPSSL